jgi:hypothetical protein
MLSVTLAELDADRQALMPSAPAPVDESERKP